MYSIIITLIVCVTLIAAIIVLSKNPITIKNEIIYLYPDTQDDAEEDTNASDFVNPTPAEEDKELSEQEKRNALMRDAASMYNMLVNGEVDLDEK